jgi:micrococcal nuclease
MRRLAGLVLLVFTACAASAARGGPGSATIAKVIDGDTIEASINGTSETVRLIGIDTPETRKPDTPVECFGVEATKALSKLLPKGTAIRLERDVEPRDRFGRLLAYVYRGRDNLFVNLEMARTGYAAAYTYPPNVAMSDQLVIAAAEARDGGLGLWSACGGGHVPA